METMHTPGPWHTNPDDSLHRAGVYAGDGDEIIICDATDEDVQENHEVMAANARLIAAAPDLLEACEAADAKFQEMYASRTGRMPEAVEMVRAAIAKAKGQSK